MNVLIADDEDLARERLRQLLGDCGIPGLRIAAEAATAAQALAMLRHQPIDLAFIDIQMPAMSGLQLAAALSHEACRPHLVFVTAHPEHALEAFEVNALDYLTKPVRLERLRQCLQRLPVAVGRAAPAPAVLIHERHGLLRIPVDEVIYFKAELKYITVRTATHSHLLETSLQELDQQYAGQFLRIHRNALVSRKDLLGLLRTDAPSEDDGWQVCLRGVPERLAVSRRQLAAVKEALHKIGA